MTEREWEAHWAAWGTGYADVPIVSHGYDVPYQASFTQGFDLAFAVWKAQCHAAAEGMRELGIMMMRREGVPEPVIAEAVARSRGAIALVRVEPGEES